MFAFVGPMGHGDIGSVQKTDNIVFASSSAGSYNDNVPSAYAENVLSLMN